MHPGEQHNIVVVAAFLIALLHWSQIIGPLFGSMSLVCIPEVIGWIQTPDYQKKLSGLFQCVIGIGGDMVAAAARLFAFPSMV